MLVDACNIVYLFRYISVYVFRYILMFLFVAFINFSLRSEITLGSFFLSLPVLKIKFIIFQL